MDTAKTTLQAALLFLLTLTAACTDNQDGESGRLAIPDSYQEYEEKGITFSYPENWSFSYDNSPSIYASRGIGLDISEFSSATILVSEDKKLTLEYVTDRFLSEFQVEEKDSIDNFTRRSDSIGKFPVETATWNDSFLGETRYELTVSKVQSKPHDVFVVLSLSDDDITSAQEHKKHFLNSIHFQ